MRVLVCGGRHYQYFGTVWRVLNAMNRETPITAIITGGCSGADTFAEEWARNGNVPVEVYKADWYTYERAAGPIRNAKMLAEGKPDLVLQFPGGAGTADMVRRARAAGVPVHEIEQ